MKAINVKETTKNRFDKIQVQESSKAKKLLSQDDVETILIEMWEQQEAGVKP